MITISQVTLEEILQVKALLGYTWIDTYGHFLSENTIQKATSSWHNPENLQAQIKNPDIYFGAARDETHKIAGIITVTKIDAQTLFMSRLYVHPDYQRQGIGSQLIQVAIKAFPGVQKLQLDVFEGNQKGLAFYLKQGFRRLRMENEEVNGEIIPSIIMEKDI
jgi:ribosomal protein S18 acetylase RimI-like enzyme